LHSSEVAATKTLEVPQHNTGTIFLAGGVWRSYSQGAFVVITAQIPLKEPTFCHDAMTLLQHVLLKWPLLANFP